MFPGSGKTFKPVFLLRLVFFPLGVWSPIYAMGVPCFHGVEYTFMFKKMWRKSGLSPERSRWLLFSVVLPAAALVGLLSVARTERGFGAALRGEFPHHAVWISAVAALSLSLNYLHFYLDGVLFRMKDPEIRRVVGPLIT